MSPLRSTLWALGLVAAAAAIGYHDLTRNVDPEGSRLSQVVAALSGVSTFLCVKLFLRQLRGEGAAGRVARIFWPVAIGGLAIVSTLLFAVSSNVAFT